MTQRCIAIASGKGGTGKTTLALNLALCAGQGVQLLDCDVEQPNAHLFGPSEPVHETPVVLEVPAIEPALCTGCGACAALCRFNAIAVVKRQAMVFPELCHACGGCALACPTAAITQQERVIGRVERRTLAGFPLVTGRLAVGHPAAPPVIHATRDHARGQLVLIDAPPGTSCAAAAAIRGVDHVVLVTEPTPFGLHDLRLAVDMARQLALSLSVVVNRSDVGDSRVRDWCASEAIAIIGEIPYDQRLAEAHAHGLPAVSAIPALAEQFHSILDRLDATSPTGGVTR